MVQASTTQTTTKTFSATTCNFVVAELERRQFGIFGSDSPYTQAESPKHTPFLSISGDTATVRVGGSPFHPMTASNDSSAVHWISHIYVQDQTGRTLFMKMLAPTSPSPAQVSFAIPTGVTSMTAYAFCNKHGLYVGPAVTHGGFGNALPAACRVDATAVRASIDLSSANGQMLAQAFVAEMRRRQSSIFEAFDPFTESVSTKHTPYIMIEGSDASVVVGKGALTGSASDIHPMTPSTNAGIVHFVNFIYVVDEQGLVVAMTPKFPDDPSPATLDFGIPFAASSLTAYEFCNKHGLYVGPSVSVATSVTTTTTVASTCDFVVAELERRQFGIFGSDSPYTQAESPKHTPFLSISGDTATVTVGGSPFHPMTASNDSSAVHWISHIYVQDQTGRTLFMKMLAPTSPSPAQVSFAIPTGVTSMTAYAFCNKHGLYVGPVVTHGGFGNASPA